MKNQAKKLRQLRMMACGVATVLVGGIGVGSMTMSGQNALADAPQADDSRQAGTESVALSAGRATRCAECGVIQTTPEFTVGGGAAGVKSAQRSFAGDSGEAALRRQEIVIRMQDGSMLVITEPNPGKWKTGERVKIMAGVDK